MTLRYGVSMKPYLLTRLNAGEAVDQADVRAFGSLDRADPAVMGRVNVADFEARALTGQAAWAQAPKRGACG